MTTRSPNAVLVMPTRTSYSRSFSRMEIRPSCGLVCSAMSSEAKILTRLTTAA